MGLWNWETGVQNLLRNKYGAGYDWGDDWRDEWESQTHSTVLGGLNFANLDNNWRPLGSRGTEITQSAFEQAFNEWKDEQERERLETEADTAKEEGKDKYDEDKAALDELKRLLQERLGNLSGLYSDWQGNDLTSFDSWLGSTGRSLGDISGYQGDIGTLVDLLESQGGDVNNNGIPDDLENARGYAAGQFGLDADEYQQRKGDLTRMLSDPDSAIGNMPGLSEEEMDMRIRYRNNQMQEIQQQQQKMLDNVLASSGSRAQYLAKSDAAMDQIRDQALAYDLAIQQEDSQRRDAEFQRKTQIWGTMVQQGQMSEEAFLRNVRADRSLAIQSLATQANMILAENQQYLSMYAADLGALQSYIQTEYDSITAQMGIESQAIEMASELYAQAMTPYNEALADMDRYFDQLEADREAMYQESLIEEQEAGDTWGIIGDVIGFAIDIGGIIAGIV